MTLKSKILSGVAVLAFGSPIALFGTSLFIPHSVAAASGMPGIDANGKRTEVPHVLYTGAGDVSVRFTAENSPRLSKWWNGRLVVNCPVGYHLKVATGTGSEHSDQYNEEATCEPNPS